MGARVNKPNRIHETGLCTILPHCRRQPECPVGVWCSGLRSKSPARAGVHPPVRVVVLSGD